MKRYIDNLTVVLVLLTAVFGMSSAIAQGTHTGNLFLTSQAEIDAFNYSEVTGSLTISGDDIDDLGPLSVLTTLGGTLQMGANPALTDVVDAFPNLTNVGGGIYVNYTSLVTFSGFDALVATGDNIDIWFNDSLVTLSGFSALQTAGWSLEIGGNPVLTEIPDFVSLQTITSSLYILDNVSLTRIEGLDSLNYVGWYVQVIGNYSLYDVCGFYAFCSNNDPYPGGGEMEISGNSSMLNDPTTLQDVMAAGPCLGPLQQQVEQLMSDVEDMDLSNGMENKLMNSLENTLHILQKKDVGS